MFDASGKWALSTKATLSIFACRHPIAIGFLVINERYHPDWHARADTQEFPIFPTNAVMMGIRIPAGLDRIQLRFEPFSSSRAAHMLMLLALVVFSLPLACFGSDPGACSDRAHNSDVDGVSGWLAGGRWACPPLRALLAKTSG